MDKFHYEANGYNRSEVNAFIERVIRETEGIINKCQEQKDEIKDLKDKLESYKILEDSINKSIVNAEKTSDNIKRLAREEANVIVSDAKNNASRIVNDALIRAERIEQQADVLERNIKIFKRKLKIIVEQQLAVVEEIEVLDLDES
ncbi:MAG: DivIVA domain-containing protein [Clostridium sp.]|nr:DivIVA domain-containing protein [Clostridium sp.]